MKYEALAMCVAMFYSHLSYLFNCGENKEAKIDDFGAIFGGIKFTQMVNNFQI